MSTTPDYLEIADTDFARLHDVAPDVAKRCMVLVICDPQLVAMRILHLVDQDVSEDASIQSEGPLQESSGDFTAILSKIRECGPVRVVEEDLVAFSDLVRLVNDPDALLDAHEALALADPEGWLTSEETDDEDSEFGAWYEDSEVVEDAEELVMLSGDSKEEAEDESGDSGRQALPSLDLLFDWSNVTKEQFVSRCQDRELLMAEASLIHQLSGASEEQTLPPASQAVIKIENGRIRIFAPHELIPDGLCRLTIVAFDRGGQVKATRLVLPPLDYRQGYWMWGTALLDLFGHDLTEMSVLTALETTAQTDFHTTEVQEFVSKLPDSEQRWLGQKYLDSNGELSQ